MFIVTCLKQMNDVEIRWFWFKISVCAASLAQDLQHGQEQEPFFFFCGPPPFHQTTLWSAEEGNVFIYFGTASNASVFSP